MTPHAGPTTQEVGATKEAAPENEEEMTWDTITSLGQIGGLSRKV
jgi:hypothetical protein